MWLAFLLLSNFLIAFAIVGKTVKDISRLNATIASERAALESRYAQRKKAGNIISNLKTVRAALPELESFFLHPGQELDLITALEEAASSQGINQKIQISPREGKTYFGDKVPLVLNISGNWNEIIRYLRELEKMKILLIIDGISFSQERREEARVAGKISGLINAHIYFSE